MSKKKVNPRKRPATMADVKKAINEAIAEAVEKMSIIFYSVLLDKFGWDREQARKLWGYVNDLCDSIEKGYVSINDLKNTLKRETGICFK